MSFRPIVHPPYTLLFIALLSLGLTHEAWTQNLQFQFTGGMQPRIGLGIDEQAEGNDATRAGVALRRARLDVVVLIGDQFGINYDVDLRNGTARTVDILGFYRPSEYLRIRMGYFASAQPRAFIPTSYSEADGLERAYVADRMARRSTGSSGRDFGVDATLSGETTTFTLFLHNGNGVFPQGAFLGGFNQNYSGDEPGMAISGSITQDIPAVAGLEAGVHAGYSGARNENTRANSASPGRAYATYSGHIYWGAEPGSQPLRLKMDVIGIDYDGPATVAPGDRTDMLALAFTGAVAVVPHGELYARFEHLDNRELDYERFLEAGIMYSLSARERLPFSRTRLTLAYAYAYDDATGLANHLVALQTQLLF